MCSWPASASSDAIRSSSDSPMPTRIPLVNGIFSSPAVRIVSSRTAGCLVGEPWWATRSGLVDSSIRPWLAVTARSRARSVASSVPRLVCGSTPAFERLLARPHDVGDEVLEAQRREAILDRRLLAGQHEQLLDPAPRGVVDQALDLLRLVQVRLVRRERAVLAVGAARPRERERDVARKCDPAHPFATIPVCDSRPSCYSRCALAGCGGVQGSSPVRRRPDRARPTSPAPTRRASTSPPPAATTRPRASTLAGQPLGRRRLPARRRTPPKGCIAVMAIVRPDEARAVRRRDHAAGRAPEGAGRRARPDARLHAGAARARRGRRRDGRRRCRVSTATSCQPSWTRSRRPGRRARRYFGELSAGPGRDPTVAADARKDE